jgi:hypothetical protein
MRIPVRSTSHLERWWSSYTQRCRGEPVLAGDDCTEWKKILKGRWVHFAVKPDGFAF